MKNLNISETVKKFTRVNTGTKIIFFSLLVIFLFSLVFFFIKGYAHRRVFLFESLDKEGLFAENRYYPRNKYIDNVELYVSELLLAGAYLHKDFIDGEIGKVATTDYEKVRVDCSPMNGYSEKIINARIKYYKAIRMIPREFQSVVRKVCCDDEEVLIYGGKWKKQQLKYHAIEMLKLGLCRLVRYYRRIKRY